MNRRDVLLTAEVRLRQLADISRDPNESTQAYEEAELLHKIGQWIDHGCPWRYGGDQADQDTTDILESRLDAWADRNLRKRSWTLTQDKRYRMHGRTWAASAVNLARDDRKVVVGYGNTAVDALEDLIAMLERGDEVTA